MKNMSWKERQKYEAPKPRVLVSMNPSARGAYSKANRGATSGGNKKHSKRWHNAQLRQGTRSEMVMRGRNKQMRLIDRGIRLNVVRKHTFMNTTARAIKQALNVN